MRPTLDQALDTTAEALEARRLAFFIGAGMSAAVGLPTAHELLELIRRRDAEKRIHKSIDDLSTAADWCAATDCRAWFEDVTLCVLKDEESWSRDQSCPSRSHQVLASLDPPIEIITTNWDELFEYHGVRDVLTLDEDPPYGPGKSTLLARIHQGKQGLIASHKDLISYEKNHPQWATYLRRVLQERTVVFVGHGLADAWLRRFISEQTLRESQAFAVDPFPDPVKDAIWADLHVSYLRDSAGQLLGAERFFEALAERMDLQVAPAKRSERLRKFEEQVATRHGATPEAGDLFAELDSGRLFFRKAVHDLAGQIGLGRWILLSGAAGSGKSATAAMATRLPEFKGRGVAYLNAAELSLDEGGLDQTARREILRLARRDVLILDDMHRNPRASVALVRALGPVARCNVVFITRPDLLSSADLKQLCDDKNCWQLELDADTQIDDIVQCRLKARGLKASNPPTREFHSLFTGDLVALSAAVDGWDGRSSVRRELAFDDVRKALQKRDGQLGMRGFPEAARALSIVSAFWRYELGVQREFMVKMGVPTETVDELVATGELVVRRSASEESETLVAAFHANRALLNVMAIQAIGDSGRLPESWIDPDWIADGKDLSYALLTIAIEKGYLNVAASHDHFVYQGFRHHYVDLIETALRSSNEGGVLELDLLLNLASAYRRLSSHEFDRAGDCLKRAQAIIEQQGRTDPAIDERRGRLGYEEGYLLYLRNRFDEAVLSLEQSYRDEMRDHVRQKRARFGMMSRLQQGVALWRAGDSDRATAIIVECIKFYAEPSSPREWSFRASTLSFMAQIQVESGNLAKAEQHLDAAVAAKHESGWHGSDMLGLRAWLLLERPEPEPVRALTLLKDEIREARDTHNPEGQGRWFCLQGRAYEQMGQISDAKNAYRSALGCDRDTDNKQWHKEARASLDRLSLQGGWRGVGPSHSN